MKFRYSILFFFLLMFSVARAQLVPNFAFESIDTTFPILCGPYTALYFNAAMEDWYSPTDASPNIFCSDTALLDSFCWNFADNIVHYSGPMFTAGPELPIIDTFGSRIYVGIQTYSPNGDNRRDYLQTKLDEPLDKNAYYKLGYNASLAEHSSHKSASLGIHFSVNPLVETGTGLINLDTAGLFPNSIVDTTDGWRYNKWFFRPDSAYEYITFGNFFHDSLTQASPLVRDSIFHGFEGTYYYIDAPIGSGFPCPEEGELHLEGGILCEGDSLEFDPILNFSWGQKIQFLWSTGSFDWGITVGDTGEVSLHIIADDLCHYYDTVQVDNYWCEPGARIGNVFTPNDDGVNDLFKPISTKDVLSALLIVYDSQGKQVFETRNLDAGWNGRVQGGFKAAGGTYYWILTIVSATGQQDEMSGYVTLLR